jgi:hypothetical protein
MSNSNAQINVLNIPLSPMRVKFNSVDVGGTTGDVTLSIKMKMSPIKVDQLGDSEIDDVVSGLHYSIKFVLAEVKNKDNWKIAFPSMKEIVNGGLKAIYSDAAIGDHLYPKAQQLLLHPLENVDADLSEDYLFYKASAQNASEVKYGPSKQTGLSVEFKVYPDTGTLPARYMFHGDPSIGLVAAIAGSPVAGANTGNGTLDTVSVTSGITKTETITATCVGSSGSGSEFAVSGSVSGALGVVNLPAANGSQVTFLPAAGSPQVISFKLHQGTVQFVLNDSFTIPTTASNYA